MSKDDNSKYRYLAKNTILFTISSFGSKILSFLLVPFYTNILTEAEYGTADLVTTTSSLLLFVVTLCISDAVLRFAIENRKTQQGVFGYGLRVVLKGSAITGFVLYAFSFFNPFNWETYIYVSLLLTIFFSAIYQLISNYLRAIDLIVHVAIMGILVTVFTISFNLILLLIVKAGVVGYLISFLAGYAFSSIYGLTILFFEDRNCFTSICDRKTQREMIHYSLPLVFNGVAWWMNNSLDRYFIIYYCGIAVNGLYAVASKIPTIITVVNQIFNQAWNLSAIKEFDAEDSNGFFSKVYSSYNSMLVLSCSVLVLANIPLARFLFSKGFFEAWNYSSILVFTAVFAALSGYFGSVFVAVKNSRIFGVSTVIAAIINALLNWVLIPVYGGIGGAVATAISFFLVWLIRFVCASRIINLNINIGRDIVSYILLIFQIVVEHTNSHMYLIQICIFFTLIVLFRREITICLKKCSDLFKRCKN